MKDEIHPQYNAEAKVTCTGCGTVYVMGTVLPELQVSVCAACHPFYTGKAKVLDSEGRVDRFKKKYEKFQKAREEKDAGKQAAK